MRRFGRNKALTLLYNGREHGAKGSIAFAFCFHHADPKVKRLFYHTR